VTVFFVSSTGGQYRTVPSGRSGSKTRVHLGLASIVPQVTTHNLCNGITLL